MRVEPLSAHAELRSVARTAIFFAEKYDDYYPDLVPRLNKDLVVAGAIFLDADEEVFPRWVGHVSVWCAVLLLPAVLVPFFKDGPFAWHGIFQFWLAAVLFFGWFAVMSAALIQAIRNEPSGSSEPSAATPLGRPAGTVAR